MHSWKISLTSFCLILGLVAFPSTSKAGAPLKQRLQPGKAYTMEVSQSGSTKMTLPGQAQPVEQKNTSIMTMRMEVRLDPENPTQKIADTFYTKIFMEIDNPAAGMKIKYDSENEVGNHPAMVGPMKAMLESKLTTIFNENDEIVEIRDLDEAFPDNPMAKQFMDKESLKRMADPGSALGFDGTERSVGDTWETEVTFPMGQMGEMRVTTQCTYEEDRKINGIPHAIITQKGSGSMEMTVPAQPGIPPLTMTMNIHEMDGELAFDLENLVLTNNKITMSSDLEMPNPIGGANMLVPVKQEVITKVTNIEDLK